MKTHDRTGQPVVNCDKDHGHNKRSQGMINVLNNIDRVPSNVQFSHQEALLYESHSKIEADDEFGLAMQRKDT